MDVSQFANLFKSLSEPVRLRILYLILEHKELCVCDIVEALEISQSVVSRHLAYLRNNGLLSTRREGVWVFYRVVKTSPFAKQLLTLFSKEAAKSTELVQDLEKLASLGTRGCD